MSINEKSRQVSLRLTDNDFKLFTQYAKSKSKTKCNILSNIVKHIIRTPLNECINCLNIDIESDLSLYTLDEIDITDSYNMITIINTSIIYGSKVSEMITITEYNNIFTDSTQLTTIISYTKMVDNNVRINKGETLYDDLNKKSRIYNIICNMNIDISKYTISEVRKIKRIN